MTLELDPHDTALVLIALQHDRSSARHRGFVSLASYCRDCHQTVSLHRFDISRRGFTGSPDLVRSWIRRRYGLQSSRPCERRARQRRPTVSRWLWLLLHEPARHLADVLKGREIMDEGGVDDTIGGVSSALQAIQIFDISSVNLGSSFGQRCGCRIGARQPEHSVPRLQ